MPVRPRRRRVHRNELTMTDHMALVIGPMGADSEELHRLREVHRLHWGRIDTFDDGKRD
jgi:hypothetical protein